MGARNYGQKQCLGGAKTGIVDLDFSWAPNGAGAVDQTTIRGMGVTSVTRTGVGVFQIVLDDSYVALIAFGHGVQLNAAAAGVIILTGAADVLTTKTINVTYMQEAAGTFAAADPAANANNRLSVRLTLRNTELGK